MTALRCAYIASNYPAVSHTFILREIQALRELGVGVETVAIRRTPPGDLLAAVDREEYHRTHALLPTTPWTVLLAHVRGLVRSPTAYFSVLATALRLTRGGLRAMLWQLFYFAESIMTWAWLERRGIRHLHAHHANVACDVAMLATQFGNSSSSGSDGRARWTWSFTLHGPTELYDVRALKLPEKAQRADAVAVTSDYVHSQLMSYLDPAGWPKLRVVRGGVDVDAFSPLRDRPERAAGAPLQILNVARLASAKGHTELLKGMAELRRRDVPAAAVIVGDGPLREMLGSEIRALGLQDCVSLAGPVAPDEIHGFYAEADVFCLPSFAEGVPNVLMEAMAMELPVVATRLMGIPELVEHGVSGLLVAPARPDQLADALQRLAEDADLRERLGRAGRERVVAEYQIDRTARQMSELLEECVGTDGARP
jgi:glycosyltransferase involved in cell wall biosynthesis